MSKIYFFNGWGMDKNLLKPVKNSTEYDIEVIDFPYNIDKNSIDKDDIFIGYSFANASSVCSTAWCSIAVVITTCTPKSRIQPLNIRLLASVPPEVKISSEGCAFSHLLIRLRAPSISTFALRPKA